MKGPLRLMLCALLLAVCGPATLCAQHAVQLKEREEPTAAARPQAVEKTSKDSKAAQAQKTAQAKKSPQARKAGKAKVKAHAGKNAQTEAQKLGLIRDVLLKPYSPGAFIGPPAPQNLQQEEENATRTDYDPVPKTGPFAEPENPSPINLRFGRDEVVDPLERKDLAKTPDAAAAAERAKKLDLKGALNKVGGKAEVQVDILKF